MLQQLRLRNFKALANVTLDFGRITVFIGPNGSGKSSPLHALTLLKQSRGQQQLITSGELVELGGFIDVVHGHDIRSLISIELKVLSRKISNREAQREF